MKYLVFIIVITTSFFSGMLVENDRMDRVTAVLMSGLTIDNANDQLNLNSKYASLIQQEDYASLNQEIEKNNKLLSDVKNQAKSICEQFKCSSKMRQHIENIENR